MTAAARDPHGGGRILTAGAPLGRARLAVVAAHGRGAGPEDMVAFVEQLAIVDVAVLAPAAAGRSWWPHSFLAPLSANAPFVESALAAFEAAVQAAMAGGLEAERILVTGFSQGGCLALEHAARSPRPYRGVVGLSAALLGTGEAGGPAREDLYGQTEKTFDYPARTDDTPVFVGCHERDPHIPLARVRTSVAVFRRLGATVREAIYPGQGHGIVADEVSVLRGLLNA